MITTIGRKGYGATRLSAPSITFGTIADVSIVVNWTLPPNAINYVLQRSTSVDFSLNLTTIYSGTSNTFTDTGLSSGVQYYYRVKALALGYIDSGYGINTTSTLGGAGQLGTPTISRLGIGTTSLSVTWPSVANATTYILQRATNSGFTTGLTTLYSGNAAGVTRAFQPGYTLEYHDSGLTPGTTYYYRVKCQAAGWTDSNYGSSNWTTGASNRTHTLKGPTLVHTDNGTNQLQIYDIPSNTVYNVYAGDTIAVNNPDTGHWLYFTTIGLHGTPTQRLTIRNQGQITMQSGFSLNSCSYMDISGANASKTLSEGIVIEGNGASVCIEVWGFSRNLVIDTIKCTMGGYSMRVKNEVATFKDDPDCGAQYAWPSHIHDIEVHHMNCLELSQDNFYLGSSGPWDGDRCVTCGANPSYCPRPTGLANIHFHDNTISGCGRSAFQMGCMDMGTNKFHDNTITECGFEYAVDQGAGFAIGGAIDGDTVEIYNNTISKTFREPAYSYNYGTLYYHNNTHSQAGLTGVKSSRAITFMQINLDPGQAVSSSWTAASQGKVVGTAEYFFEFFYAPTASTPQMKVTRRDNNFSASEITIPTAFPASISVTLTSNAPTYAVGQLVKVMRDPTNWFKGDVVSWNSGTKVLVLNVTSSSGSGTYLSWQVFKENQTPFEAVQSISTTDIGAHAGTTVDPYVGFGASSTITASQVVYMTDASIPSGNAVGNFMVNPFNSKPITTYGSPKGLTKIRLENNSFGSQQAPSTKVVSFINSTNNYNNPSILCGNTYLGGALASGNIQVPGGGVVTYTLDTSCIPATTLVESQDTFNTAGGTIPGLTWKPSDYSDPANAAKTYPLIIFLHGSGEASSTRNDSLLKSTSLPEIISLGQWNGIAKDPVTNIYKQFIVCAPQQVAWSESGGDLAATLTDILATYRIDTTRIYITGLSAGGSGTISTGSQTTLRNNVCAIMPIAAAGFNSPGEDAGFDNVMINNIKMLTIVGASDGGWYTFNSSTLINRYNSYSPTPTTPAICRVVAAPASHDENTWNACFQTTFDVNNGVGTPMNVYEWMLQYHK